MSVSLWRRLFGSATSASVPPPSGPSMNLRPKLHRASSGSMDYPRMSARFGKRGHTKGCFNMPCGVAVTAAGDIIVADTENNRVLVFNQDGQLKVRIGQKGAMPHELNHPMGVALSRDGEENICVTDSVNASIKIFQQDGSFVTAYCQNGTFDFPYGIVVTSEQYFVVTDVCRHSIIILYPSGSVRNQFGKYGDGLNDFDHPHFVAINSKDHIVVSDSGNTCIKIFTIDGAILQNFSLSDFRLYEEHYVLLNGVTVDADDNILIIGNCSVYIAAHNGRMWEVLVPEDGLHSPKNLAYSSLGQLVVTQCGLDHRHEICLFWYEKEHYRSLRSVPYLAVNSRPAQFVRQRHASCSDHSSSMQSSMTDSQFSHRMTDSWCSYVESKDFSTSTEETQQKNDSCEFKEQRYKNDDEKDTDSTENLTKQNQVEKSNRELSDSMSKQMENSCDPIKEEDMCIDQTHQKVKIVTPNETDNILTNKEA